ncbi:MAG TPA: hypothetical protein VLE89_07985 [Chlamydiales bacterium]|nr:hypothetical protein [Chlamydiales bacterium]
MIAERPGGVNPNEPNRNTPDTKAQREERQRVEKVREVDPDEEAQRRRKKFQMMMGDEDQLSDATETNRAPSPFETEFYKGASAEEEEPTTPLSEPDVDNAAVPSPAYSSPPDVQASPPEETEEAPGNLPSSENFWSDADLPDAPPHPLQFKETPKSAARNALPGEEKKGTKKPGTAGMAPSVSMPGKTGKKEPSPFGVPGKTTQKKSKDEEPSPFFGAKPEIFGTGAPSKGKKLSEKEETPTARYLSREEEQAPSSGWVTPFKEEKESLRPGKEGAPKPEGKKGVKSSQEREAEMAPYHARQREQDKEGRKEKEKETMEIQTPSQTLLPPSVQPIAQTAAMQAAPYLSPQTLPLFFQMVGTMYVMVTPPGISRTEIVLNNPSFANSKFYGTTITIEKYTTAPDSFNIRLTGPDAAVVAFRENIPTLMTAFQNGNFSFRVNRLDAEFSIERPLFRRRDRGEGKGSGDLGERRK